MSVGRALIAYQIIRGLTIFVDIMRYAMLAYCIMSWIVPPDNRIYVFLARFLDPVLSPVRSLMNRLFRPLPIDISPIIAIFLLQLLLRIVTRIILAFL